MKCLLKYRLTDAAPNIVILISFWEYVVKENNRLSYEFCLIRQIKERFIVFRTEFCVLGVKQRQYSWFLVLKRCCLQMKSMCQRDERIRLHPWSWSLVTLHSAADPVSEKFRSGSGFGKVQIRSRFQKVQIRIRFRKNLDLVLVLKKFRSGSGFAKVHIRIRFWKIRSGSGLEKFRS